MTVLGKLTSFMIKLYDYITVNPSREFFISFNSDMIVSSIGLTGSIIGRGYMLGAAVFTLKFVDQHEIVNIAAPNMYTRPIDIAPL